MVSRMSDDVSSQALALDTYFNAGLTRDAGALNAVGRALAAGRLVVVRDAFHAAFADRMHRALDTCSKWRAYEAFEDDFHYHHHNLYDERDYPPDLGWCSRVFGSLATKALATRLSGRNCDGPTTFSASWYLPGDHSLPHTDAVARSATANRQVAFVWHLAKDWRREWGGALFWCPQGRYLPPQFNSLVLFNVGPDTSHFVTHVSPYAQGKRLAINGWWTGPDATGTPRDHDAPAADGPVEIY